MKRSILERIQSGQIMLGDGGYLLELERRGWVDSGSGREKVGTGKGSGQFTPEVAIQHPDALRELHREFLNAGSDVLQALTFFGTREKLNRAGFGSQTEAINAAAVRIARESPEIKRSWPVPSHGLNYSNAKDALLETTFAICSLSRFVC